MSSLVLTYPDQKRHTSSCQASRVVYPRISYYSTKGLWDYLIWHTPFSSAPPILACHRQLGDPLWTTAPGPSHPNLVLSLCPDYLYSPKLTLPGYGDCLLSGRNCSSFNWLGTMEVPTFCQQFKHLVSLILHNGLAPNYTTDIRLTTQLHSDMGNKRLQKGWKSTPG